MCIYRCCSLGAGGEQLNAAGCAARTRGSNRTASTAIPAGSGGAVGKRRDGHSIAGWSASCDDG